MSTNTIYVKNIGSHTDDKEIKDFFSFCGTVTDLKVTQAGETKNATVTFAKDHAAKTAVLLNNTVLDRSTITVSAAEGAEDSDGSHYKHNEERESDEITQEEKPRARILAEYLAHGYVIGDAALQRAIDLDHKHGVTARFLSTLQQLDTKYHATDRAKTADTSYGITSRASSIISGLGSYFEKATNTPTGKRIVKFYTESQRQVNDIHNEARRLADLKKQEHGGSAYKAAGLDKVFGPEKTEPTVAPPQAAAPDVGSATTTHASASASATSETVPPKA